MSKGQPTYSRIIHPKLYNEINNQHLYIRDSDDKIEELIIERTLEKGRQLEVVEVGCGPARLTEIIGGIGGIRLTAIDHDKGAIEYARKWVPSIDFKVEDANTYRHNKPVDIFYMQGAHHHIEKPPVYLVNLRGQLAKDGIIILSDEFLPAYKSEKQRRVKSVVWHSHIIANAIRNGYSQLAEEEAKTLLDDLNQGADEKGIKTKMQISFVLRQARPVDYAAMKVSTNLAEMVAGQSLNVLRLMHNTTPQDEPSMNLSRGDYKISDSVLRMELASTGFKVESASRFGPNPDIGSLAIYVLKPAT